MAVLVGARMDGQRVRKVLGLGQFGRKCSRELNLVFPIEIAWQREIGANVQPAVGPLIYVGGIPVLA